MKHERGAVVHHLTTAGLFSIALLCATAEARPQIGAAKATSPIRDAGTYHLATGTWTRRSTTLATSPDAIYRNDAPTGYFLYGWEGCWSVDEIMLPGPGNPYAGSQDAYRIDGLEFAYCKQGSGTVDWYLGFYDGYTPCDDPAAPSNCISELLPQPYVVPGLPGGSACWIVTVDLSGGLEVCMQADGGGCDPGYQGSGLGLDHGGIGFAWKTSDGGVAGPLRAGEYCWIPPGEGTCYRPGFTSCVPYATGLGMMDLFAISDHNGFTDCHVGNGCYWFGGTGCASFCGAINGNALIQFHFVLFADCATTCAGNPTLVYCDETHDPNNAADVGISTSDSSSSSIELLLAQAPPGMFAYPLVGDGTGVVADPPGAKGSLCVAGGACLGRYDKDVQTIASDGTARVDLKNAASQPCGGAVQIVPGAVWNFQYWHRQPMGQASTFSSAIQVKFQ